MCADDVCAVCCESQEIVNQTTLSCGHSFHGGCLVELINAAMSSFLTQVGNEATKMLVARTISFKCPICRSPFQASATNGTFEQRQWAIRGTQISLHLSLSQTDIMIVVADSRTETARFIKLVDSTPLNFEQTGNLLSVVCK